MIPTMLLVGLVFGRWWWVTIPLGTLAWVVLLIVTGVGSGISFALGAPRSVGQNVIVGVLAYHGIAWLIRGFVRTSRPAQQG